MLYSCGDVFVLGMPKILILVLPAWLIFDVITLLLVKIEGYHGWLLLILIGVLFSITVVHVSWRCHAIIAN